MAGKWAIDWTGEQRSAVSPLGAGNTAMTKHSESMSKDGLAISGETSTDGGKTWMKAYDATCTNKK